MRSVQILAASMLVACGAEEPVVVHGDLQIVDEAELDGLAGVSEVTGHLEISDTRAVAIFLPDLERVGDLTVHANRALLDLDLPALRRVEGDVAILYNNQPLATDATATLTCSAQALFEAVGVGGDVLIYGNAGEAAVCGP